ncbi:NAD(P)H-binding protein [Brevibacterium litoralis]|uniref:NAD(P)H-binding protein n=1 Tax=Brevibacterium litoralis TaxID=3138935 RepID=UPI0032EFB767
MTETSAAPENVSTDYPQTVAVVGGHGKIALLLTRILADRGVGVRNLVRNPDHAADVEAAGGTTVVCDVEVAGIAEITEALGDADAVIYAAGAGGGSDAFRKFSMDMAGSVKSIQAAHALQESKGTAVRFVQISFVGAQNPVAEGTDAIFTAYWDGKRIADDALKASYLPWTIVKPGALLDDPATGNLSVDSGTSRGVKTIRGDVAGFIALVLGDPRTVNREFDIWDGEQPMDRALEEFLA